jgi:hypothetical protein
MCSTNWTIHFIGYFRLNSFWILFSMAVFHWRRTATKQSATQIPHRFCFGLVKWENRKERKYFRSVSCTQCDHTKSEKYGKRVTKKTSDGSPLICQSAIAFTKYRSTRVTYVALCRKVGVKFLKVQVFWDVTACWPMNTVVACSSRRRTTVTLRSVRCLKIGVSRGGEVSCCFCHIIRWCVVSRLGSLYVTQLIEG